MLDITTTEWADEVCGGVFSAGTQRLEAAARAGIPQYVFNVDEAGAMTEAGADLLYPTWV